MERRLYLPQWIRNVAVVCGLVLGMSGCLSSSIRFTNSDGSLQSKHIRYVPTTWDYRKSYTVPNDRLKRVAKGYLGIRYRWGGMSRKGVDCSGLVCMIYYEVTRAKLPHSTRKLHSITRPVTLRGAKNGDLVFFRGRLGNINHVGIFLGDNTFIHASTHKGVIYSKLDNTYYKKRFVDVRRVFK